MAGSDDVNLGTTAEGLSANARVAFDYFIGQGLSAVQAAGIVGNLVQESNVVPTAVQAGGPGRGIAQWSVGGRWDTDGGDNVVAYAGSHGASPWSLNLQLDFIWYELTHFSSYGLAALQATTNVTDATVAFETDFEGCGTCDQTTRVSYAMNVLSVFGGTDAGSADAGGSGPDAATPCTVKTTGDVGECLDKTVCAALGNHVSTAGFCPGPNNIECCTSTGGPADAGGPVPDAATKADAGSDAGGKPPPPKDAGTVKTPHDAAVTDARTDAGARANVDAAAGDAAAGNPGSSGGCAMSPRDTGSTGSALWVLGLAAVTCSRRRRRSRGSRRRVLS